MSLSPPPDDPTKADFWDTRYRSGNAGWDLGEPAPPFVDLLAQQNAPPPDTMIVLGCGRGHDAIFFAQNKFEVTGVDFSPAAVQDAKEGAIRAGVEVTFLQHDIFTLPPSYNYRFTYVVEHTCFAAIPPSMRSEYVVLVRRLLQQSGLYIALYFAHGIPGGPPFDTNVDEIRTLFGPSFNIEHVAPPVRSAPQRQGKELLALMRPKQSTRGIEGE